MLAPTKYSCWQNTRVDRNLTLIKISHRQNVGAFTEASPYCLAWQCPQQLTSPISDVHQTKAVKISAHRRPIKNWWKQKVITITVQYYNLTTTKIEAITEIHHWGLCTFQRDRTMWWGGGGEQTTLHLPPALVSTSSYNFSFGLSFAYL
jgi:hypothetical protein